jgi:hypothetical protein
MPNIDFGFYRSSASSSGTDSCGNNYLQTTSPYTNQCDDSRGNTYFITGDWTGFKSAIVGNVIVLGNLNFQNGKASTLGTYAAKVPPQAWKQYCNDWSDYQAWDAYAVGKPACFGNLSTNYNASGVTLNISPEIHGFVYVGGDLNIPNGGGNSDLVHGSLIIQGNANINSGSATRIWYDPDIVSNIVATTINLNRVSWFEIQQPWTCPPLDVSLCP